MRTLQVNIGLNNNPIDVVDYMASDSNYRLMAYQIVDMTFMGETEPTFAGLFEYKYSRQSKVLQDFENMASVMTQESIALSTDFMEVMAFSPSYCGDGYAFDRELFKYITI